MIHYKTDIYPMQVKRVSCDAEIGSIKRGWHVCNKKAAYQCDGFGAIQLHFCEIHKSHTVKHGRKNAVSL
jgi:hypothetical protein